jgi:hypothetical protein
VEVQELLAPGPACYRSHSIPLSPVTRPASQASRGQGCLYGEHCLAGRAPAGAVSIRGPPGETLQAAGHPTCSPALPPHSFLPLPAPLSLLSLLPQNDVGIVAWVMTLRTPECPQGRQVVAIANDITYNSGGWLRGDGLRCLAICAELSDGVVGPLACAESRCCIAKQRVLPSACSPPQVLIGCLALPSPSTCPAHACLHTCRRVWPR